MERNITRPVLNPSSWPPADIESVEVFKDARAIELYGEKGKKGVIIIKKKKKQGTRQPDAV